MVADVLDQTWNILSKQEIEERTGVNLNFSEYMALKQGESQFIKNASKETLNSGPHRPEMLNLVLSPKKCVKIYTENLVNFRSKYCKTLLRHGKRISK